MQARVQIRDPLSEAEIDDYLIRHGAIVGATLQERQAARDNLRRADEMLRAALHEPVVSNRGASEPIRSEPMSMAEQRDAYVRNIVHLLHRPALCDVAFDAYTEGYLAGVQSQVVRQAEKLVAGRPSGFQEIADAVH